MTKWRPDLIDLRLVDQHTLDVLAAAARGSGGHSLTYPLPQLVAEQERRKKAEMDDPAARAPQRPPNPAPAL